MRTHSSLFLKVAQVKEKMETKTIRLVVVGDGAVVSSLDEHDRLNGRRVKPVFCMFTPREASLINTFQRRFKELI